MAHRYWIHSGSTVGIVFTGGARQSMPVVGGAVLNPFDPDENVGVPVLRAGSITGISCITTITIFFNIGFLIAEANVNGTKVFEASSPQIGGTGVFAWNLTQAPGIDLVSPSDLVRLSLFGDPVDHGDGTIQAEVSNTIIVCEVTF